MTTHHATRGGKGNDAKLVSEELAIQERLTSKAKAPMATITDFVEYFMSHDGNPPQYFVIKVRKSPEEMDIFVEDIQRALTDPDYAESFFDATGKILNVCQSHAKRWAEQIASAVLEQTPTRQ